MGPTPLALLREMTTGEKATIATITTIHAE